MSTWSWQTERGHRYRVGRQPDLVGFVALEGCLVDGRAGRDRSAAKQIHVSPRPSSLKIVMFLGHEFRAPPSGGEGLVHFCGGIRRGPSVSTLAEDEGGSGLVGQKAAGMAFGEHPHPCNLRQTALRFQIFPANVAVDSGEPDLLQVLRSHGRRRCGRCRWCRMPPQILPEKGALLIDRDRLPAILDVRVVRCKGSL